MKNIVIRTLGGKGKGKGIGYGHLYRCLSLAKAIRLLDKDIKIIFLINKELVGLLEDTKFDFILSNNLSEDFEIIDKLSIDLFILDSYLGDNEYLKKVKKKGKLMLIDDNNDIYDSSIPDIIYNGNIHAEGLGYPSVEGQLKLLGSKYLIMKEEYWEIKQDEDIQKEGILITTGGTDEHGVVVEIMDAIKDLDIKSKIIIGPGYSEDHIEKIEGMKTENMELIYRPSSLKEYISSSEIVITAGGSTVYEVLSQNSIPIIFSIADNQDLICKELRDRGLEYLGKYPDIEYTRLIETIEGSYGNYHFDEKILNLINGYGVKLVVEAILLDMQFLISESITSLRINL